MFYWLLSLLLKIDTATFNVIMTDYSQDITSKKQSLRHLPATAHSESLLRSKYNQ